MQSVRNLRLSTSGCNWYSETRNLDERPPYYYLCTSQESYDRICSILDPIFKMHTTKKHNLKIPLYICIGPQNSVAYLLRVRGAKELAKLQRMSTYYSCAESPSNPMFHVNIFMSSELSELLHLEKTQCKSQSETEFVAVIGPSNLKPWKRIVVIQDENSNLNSKHLPSIVYIRIQLFGVAFKNLAKLILRDGCGRRIAIRMECSAETDDSNKSSAENNSSTHYYGYVSDTTCISIQSLYSDYQRQLIQKNFQTLPLLRNIPATQFLQALLTSLEKCHQGRFLPTPRSVLLYGPSGMGKSYLVKQLATQQNWQLIYATLDKISFLENDNTISILFDEVLQDKSYLGQYTESTTWLHKKILFFDDIDMMFNNEEWTFSKHLDQIKAQFILGMHKLTGKNVTMERNYDSEWWDVEDDRMAIVIVIATSSKISALDRDVRKMFEKELEFPSISHQEQLTYLENLTQRLKGTPFQIDREKLSQVIEKCNGLSFLDLELLFRNAVTANIQHFKHKPNNEVHSNFLEEKLTTLAKNSKSKYADPHLLPASKPILASLLGGLSKQLFQLTQSTMWIHMYPKTFARLGISPHRGILLYGPPGTGKTSLVRNLAVQSKTNFISVSIQNLHKPYLGESERAIIDLFNRARQVSPCIIFIDEIQAVFRPKDSHDSAYSRCITSLLLMELDGILNTKQDVVFIAATNHPDWLDSSLLRPGRLDKHLYIPPPDAEARVEILTLFIKNELENQTLSPDCCSEHFIQTLVEKTEGFTGADLKNLIMTSKRKAAMNSKAENVLDNLQQSLKINVSKELILEVLSNTAPSVSKEMLQEYAGFQKRHNKANWQC